MSPRCWPSRSRSSSAAAIRLSPRAIEQAPLRVLAGVNMPAVLVEVGFLTNPDEEQQLVSETYQNAVAQALLDGLLRFRERAGQAASPEGALPPAEPVRRRP